MPEDFPPLRPRHAGAVGRVVRLWHRSELLRDNPWGDPHERELCVWLPAGYRDTGAAHAALWDLAAFGNAGPGHLNWRGHGENLPQRLDRLTAAGVLPPVVVVMPDAYTALGGNQYLDSPAVGAYDRHLAEELLPLVSAEFNVVDGRDGRAAFGTSSGGFGALWQAMRHPRLWGAVAAHAPDCGFEWVYAPALPVACRVLARHGGDPLRFLEWFWSARRPGGEDHTTLMVLAMAASYDPDPASPRSIRLPVDLHGCELNGERWQRWLAHDPLRAAGDHSEALRALHGLWLDVGSNDEYHIQFGLRRLAARLEELGISHHFEEFEGTHRGLDWRLDLSLPWLASRLPAANTDHS